MLRDRQACAVMTRVFCCWVGVSTLANTAAPSVSLYLVTRSTYSQLKGLCGKWWQCQFDALLLQTTAVTRGMLSHTPAVWVLALQENKEEHATVSRHSKPMREQQARRQGSP